MLAIVGIYLFQAFRLYSSNLVNDDAFIFYRYAEHWAGGHGIVWNIGEPHLDGFTSFLYLVLLAGAARVGFPPLAAGQLIGIASAALTLIVLERLTAKVLPASGLVLRLAPPGILAVTPAFVMWSRRGMETPLFGLLLLGAVAAHIREVAAESWRSCGIASGFLFAVAALARPDALLFWGLAQIHILVLVVHNLEPFAPRATLSPWISFFERRWPGWTVFLTVFGPFAIWHAFYFRSLLPNTFYAKTGMNVRALEAGAGYVLRLLKEPYGTVLWLLPLSLLFSKRVSLLRRSVHWFICGTTAAYLGYVMVIGGDPFPDFRFFLFVYPLILLVCADTLGRVSLPTRRTPQWHSVVVAGAILSWGAWVFGPSFAVAVEWSSQPTRPLKLVDAYDGSNPVQHERELIGRYFAQLRRPGDSLAVVPAGAIPYYSGMRAIDMLGLNDRFLAHEAVDPGFVRDNPRGWFPGHVKGDGNYVLRLRPRYIILAATLTTAPGVVPGWFLRAYRPTQQIARSEVFHRCYVSVTVNLEGRYLTYFQLKPECATKSHATPVGR
jgi:arabinofuranosyltransferase